MKSRLIKLFLVRTVVSLLLVLQFLLPADAFIETAAAATFANNIVATGGLTLSTAQTAGLATGGVGAVAAVATAPVSVPVIVVASGAAAIVGGGYGYYRWDQNRQRAAQDRANDGYSPQYSYPRTYPFQGGQDAVLYNVTITGTVEREDGTVPGPPATGTVQIQGPINSFYATKGGSGNSLARGFVAHGNGQQTQLGGLQAGPTAHFYFLGIQIARADGLPDNTTAPPYQAPEFNWDDLSDADKQRAWGDLTPDDFADLMNEKIRSGQPDGFLVPGTDVSDVPFFDLDGNPLPNPGTVPENSPDPNTDPGTDPDPDGNTEGGGENPTNEPFELEVNFDSAAQNRPFFIAYAWQEAQAQNKFPFGIFAGEIDVGELTCPTFTFWEKDFELCIVLDFLRVLKIPVVIAFSIWAFMAI